MHIGLRRENTGLGAIVGSCSDERKKGFRTMHRKQDVIRLPNTDPKLFKVREPEGTEIFETKFSFLLIQNFVLRNLIIKEIVPDKSDIDYKKENFR